MTSPAVTCPADVTLAEAAGVMQHADTGSVVVTDHGKVVGILTERDLLRAAVGAGDPRREKVALWMTARPDVLGPDERVDAAWASLTSHHYRHLPVVEATNASAWSRCATSWAWRASAPPARRAATCPPGSRASSWPRRRSATSAGRRASSTTASTRPSTWRSNARSRTCGISSSGASCPTPRPRRRSATRCAGGARMPPGLSTLLPALARRGAPLDVLRTAVSVLASELGWRPTHDIGRRRAGRPGHRAVRRGADHPRRRPPPA